ncbi:transglutaminase domain-containing protein [Clostridium sp.]|jgi:transglutaminase-like putative cysteine protease|uniref:transglutaminase-like domain-containing protein n=1 Tax=Clostridium sp. TaxID=1506 RepID=UPI003EEC4432
MWMKEKLIYIIIIFVNFNLILRLLQQGIQIKDFSYEITTLLFIIGNLIYFACNGFTRKTIYKLLFTLLIISMGTAYYLKNSEALGVLLSNYFFDNILILNDLIYEGAITYFYQYRLLLALGIPLITALILWITFKFMKNFILIVSFTVVIGLWFSRSYVVVIDYLFVYLFISSLTFIIMSYLKRIQKYKAKGVNVSLKFGYILGYGVIIALIISKIAIMLPQEYQGKDLSGFGNFFKNEFVNEATSKVENSYSLSTSGYNGNDKRLGGPILVNYQEVFKVKSEKPYYLKGSVKDFYDGSKWSISNENYFKKSDESDMFYARFGMNREKYMHKRSLTIYPDKKFKTNTIFAPNFAFNVSNVQSTLFYDKTPIIISEKAVTRPYDVHFYEYSEVIDTIEDVRDYSAVPRGPMNYYLKPKSINADINKNSSIQDKFSNSDDGTNIKVLLDYEKYLQVPENISKRTYDLVFEIIKDSNTSIEKVLEIKKYLTENYSYDLQVSVIPEGKEFIDYFLFEEKKGYCTYFNTAITVMCRIAGVPARYVEGFKTPSEKDENGLYTVSNSDAHAWGEVVLGAFSYSNMWTIVDASPTASEELQRKLAALKEKQISKSNSEGEDITSIRNPENKIDDMDSGKEQGENKSITISDNQFRVLFILTTILLFILMKIRIVLKNRNNLLQSKEVAPLYNYYLDRLAVISIIKPEFQGDLEFAKQISDIQLKERMLVLVESSYEEFYGKHSPLILDNKEYYEFLEKYLKEYQGKIKYLTNKYFG